MVQVRRTNHSPRVAERSAQQSSGADALQPPLRSRFRARLTASVSYLKLNSSVFRLKAKIASLIRHEHLIFPTK
jgi:hypothetical protein